MIVIKLIGGIGNQLFECALGLYLSNKWNTKLYLDVSELNHGSKIVSNGYESTYALDNFKGNFNVIDSSDLRFSPEENAVYFKDRKLTIVR